MAKRKASLGPPLWKTKVKKRVAFSAPKASAKAIMSRNQSESPLLRLPLELRNKIWSEVLGESLIHLKYNYVDDSLNYEDHDEVYHMTFDRSPWRHIVCADDGPEDRPAKKWVPNKWYDYAPGCENNVLMVRPHGDCKLTYEKPISSKPIEFRDHETMRLTVLRVCRQMYVEANLILWTTNTFSFCNGETFQRFMMTRTIHQKRLIRSMRFEMEWGAFGEHKTWYSALNMPLIRSMIGLQSIRLNIVYDMKQSDFDVLKVDFITKGNSFTEGLRKLSTLPLVHAEVLIRLHEYSSELGLWKKADRDRCAEALRNILIDPNGAEVYAAHQRQLKETMARSRENTRIRARKPKRLVG